MMDQKNDQGCLIQWVLREEGRNVMGARWLIFSRELIIFSRILGKFLTPRELVLLTSPVARERRDESHLLAGNWVTSFPMHFFPHFLDLISRAVRMLTGFFLASHLPSKKGVQP